MSRPIRVTPMSPPSTRHRGDDWREQAACATPRGIEVMDAAIQGMHGPGRSTIAVREAKTYCAKCPVTLACLRELGDLPHGVIGGLSAEERGHLIDQPRTRTCGLPECDAVFVVTDPRKTYCCNAHQAKDYNRKASA